MILLVMVMNKKKYECFWDWFSDAIEEMINEDECDG